jgi:hypothetical protein
MALHFIEKIFFEEKIYKELRKKARNLGKSTRGN